MHAVIGDEDFRWSLIDSNAVLGRYLSMHTTTREQAWYPKWHTTNRIKRWQNIATKTNKHFGTLECQEASEPPTQRYPESAIIHMKLSVSLVLALESWLLVMPLVLTRQFRCRSSSCIGYVSDATPEREDDMCGNGVQGDRCWEWVPRIGDHR